MNRILKYIPLLLVLLALTSCSTRKVVFSGKPGTEIHEKNYYGRYYSVGKVESSKHVEVKLYKEPQILLYKDPESGTEIPFVPNLNPKRKESNIVALGWVFLVLWGIGLAGILPIALGEVPLGIITGTALSLILYFGFGLNKSYFIPEQTIPQDIVFTPLVETADYKTFVPKAQRMNAQPKNGSQRANTTRRSGNSRYKADDDYTKNVIGTYSGNGKLMFEGAVTEKYNDIKVVIEKVSGEANMVTVNVLLDDGNPYFGSKSKYSIIKNDDEYVLIHESVNSTISINQYGELVYLNNDVEDDNGTNILKINADKE